VVIASAYESTPEVVANYKGLPGFSARACRNCGSITATAFTSPGSGKAIVLLLCGGDKSRQKQDIKQAIAMAQGTSEVPQLATAGK
jgi:hypothetical protein